MNASSDDSFLQDHEYISRRLQWQLEPTDPSEEQLQQFYQRLNLGSGTKIVVWDNVDHPSELIRFANSLPSTKSTCILITSRDVGFSRIFAKDSGCIHLAGLSTSESVALLKATIKTNVANDTLRTIADQLDGLPLAISLAGSHMSQHHVSPLGYKYIPDKARQDFLDFGDYDAHTLYRPFEISLNRLESEDVTALETLYFMSVLDASPIPKYLLLSRSSDLKSRFSMKDLNSIIASLRSYSLVRLTQDQTCLDMHGLVQKVIRRRLYSKGIIAAWENAALKAVSLEFPQGNSEEWGKCRELLPHALVVLECDVAKDAENASLRYELLRNAGIYKMRVEGYQVAEKLLQEAYVVSMKQFGQDSVCCQTVATSLAHLFLLMGRLPEAEQLEMQVLKISSKVLAPEHPVRLNSMSNLASIYRDQRRYKEAEQLEMQVIETSKQFFGEEHSSTLISITNLASTYKGQSRWKEAEDLQVRVVEMSRKTFGKRHPRTLTNIANLASTYKSQGLWEEAEYLLVQVIEVSKKVLGKNHPSTFTIIANLASIYKSQGLWEEAEYLLVQVIEVSKKVLGKDHPSTLTSIANLASIYQSQERWEEAVDLQAQVIEMRKRIRGEEHPRTLTSIANLAST